MMKTLNWIALILIIIGGINWGLVGLFNFNLVSAIFGDMSWFSRLIYILVGISAIYIAFVSPKLVRTP
ncbi:MAG: DUF378 domain-containing protein [Syntrophales bacterium]|jgi:uncharacterized membrane protein YuzA (DUF378 family)|nr:DUF378 domain-containing protein [Syntrophales bacterium]